MDLSIQEKISTLSSNTCVTGETAFRESVEQRYCFVAWRNGVISTDELEGMQIMGSVKRSAWDLRMVKMRWSDSSFDRMAWERRSCSLQRTLSAKDSKEDYVEEWLTSR